VIDEGMIDGGTKPILIYADQPKVSGSNWHRAEVFFRTAWIDVARAPYGALVPFKE
jgi:hypothetical protein